VGKPVPKHWTKGGPPTTDPTGHLGAEALMYIAGHEGCGISPFVIILAGGVLRSRPSGRRS
jgi:LDH2 family malate/lactate/ureidoglycolate dehydrogenase